MNITPVVYFKLVEQIAFEFHQPRVTVSQVKSRQNVRLASDSSPTRVNLYDSSQQVWQVTGVAV